MRSPSRKRPPASAVYATGSTWEALAAAQTSLVRLWQKAADLPAPDGPPLDAEMAAFEEAMGADLNTPRALAVLWEVADSPGPAERVAATFQAMDRILGLDLARAAERLEELRSIQVSSKANEEKAMALAEERAALRRQKEFAKADALRAQIFELGFIVEDTPQGPRLKPKGPKA